MQSFATKAKKAITKVAALGTGVAMMGATITGALAVSINLNDYPASFKDSLIVVGSAASGADDAAALDISGDIPTTSKVSQISGDTYNVEKTGDAWNINQDMSAIDSSVTDTELDLLSDQTFKDDEGTNTGDYDYTQTLVIPANATHLLFDIDDSDTREGNPADLYLKFVDTINRYTWNYTVKFSGSKIKVKDAADIENNVLSILGRDWTITDASMSNSTYGLIDKMTLLAGDVLSTILQGSTVGGVTVIDVDEAETKCILEYAGKTYIVDKGQTKTFDDGTIVGVTDVTAVHEAGAGQDMCELAIGAHKLVIEDGKPANLNNEDVDTSLVYISGDSATADIPGLKSIIVSYQPEDITWKLPGESLEDPVFGAFKIVYNQLKEEDMEEIKIDLVGDKIKLKVKNSEGDVFDDAFCFLNGTGTNRNFQLGYSQNKPMAVFEGQNISNYSVGSDGVAPKGLKNIRFLMSFDGVSHIAEISTIDTTTNKTTIKLLDSGEVYKDMDYVDGTTTTFSDLHDQLVLAYNINLDKGSTQVPKVASINFTNIYDKGPSWFTENDGRLTFLNVSGGPDITDTYLPGLAIAQNGSGCDLAFSEQGYNSKSVDSDVILYGVSKNNITAAFRYDASDDQIEWNRTGSGSLVVPGSTGVALKVKNDDTQYEYVGRTIYGTKIEQYQKDDGDLTIWYPSDQVEAEVLIAASEAVTGTMGTIKPVLESDVTDVAAQNVILVGGPCANGLTASLTGDSKAFPDCNKNYKPGEALLKLVDNGNKVALVVAGYNAQDTQRAAVALGGTLPSKKEAKVTGTSLELSEITVVGA